MKTILFILFVFALSHLVTGAPKKNIVLNVADDIAYDNNLGTYWAQGSWTPWLDQLADRRY